MGIVYAAFIGLTLLIGLGSGVLRISSVEYSNAIRLAIAMWFFPSLLEEFVFRGLLIPRHAADKGNSKAAAYVLISTALFVIWHPINAWLFNTTARAFFYDPVMLLIIALMGLCCGISYVLTRSLWIPVSIHWLTIVAWVFLLGGHSMLGEVMSH